MSKVAREVAEADFDRFIELNEIDAGSNKDDRESFEQQREIIVRAIERGTMAINDDGEPVYTYAIKGKDPTTLTFHEPTGASLMAMDRKKAGQDVAKLFGTMADITRTDPKTFSAMPQRYLRVCMAVTTLFLG